MEDQKEIYEEIKELLKPEQPKVEIRRVEIKPEPNLDGKTDAEITSEFLEEYRKLVRKYKRDFNQTPPQIVKLEFSAPPPKETIKIENNHADI